MAPAAGNLRFWTGLLFLSRASVSSAPSTSSACLMISSMSRSCSRLSPCSSSVPPPSHAPAPPDQTALLSPAHLLTEPPWLMRQASIRTLEGFGTGRSMPNRARLRKLSPTTRNTVKCPATAAISIHRSSTRRMKVKMSNQNNLKSILSLHPFIALPWEGERDAKY